MGEIANYLESDATVDVIPTASTKISLGDNYKQKMVGLFRAPRSGEYRFYVTSDDASRVWLSTDDSADNAGDPIIDFHSHSSFRNDMILREDTRSEPQTLVADTYYYIEIWHAEGGGGDHF